MSDSLLVLDEGVADAGPVAVDQRIYLANRLLSIIYYGNFPEDSRNQVSGVESRAKALILTLDDAVRILNGVKGIATLPGDLAAAYVPQSGSGIRCKDGIVYLVSERA